MKRTPNFPQSEWRVMKVLWEESPLTANDVVEKLTDDVSWTPKTIKTLLNRLVKKEALGFTKDGRLYRYHPLVEEADCVRAERSSFLSRVYGGALSPMLAHFIEDEDLNAEEINELRSILEKKRSAQS